MLTRNKLVPCCNCQKEMYGCGIYLKCLLSLSIENYPTHSVCVQFNSCAMRVTLLRCFIKENKECVKGNKAGVIQFLNTIILLPACHFISVFFLRE